jgi:leucyl aminopeptidase
MDIRYEKGDLSKIKACDALVLLVDETWKKSPALVALDKLLDGELIKRAKKADFKGKRHASFTLQSFYKTSYDRVLLWGVGDWADCGAEDCWDLGHKIVTQLRNRAVSSVTIAAAFPDASQKVIAKLVQGALSGEYRFDRYKPEAAKENKSKDLKSLTLFDLGENALAPKQAAAAIERGIVLGDSVNFARDLVNEPAETMTPQIFASVISRMAKEAGLAVKVENETQIAKRKMNLFLAVARGSKNPPRLITVTHDPKGATGKPIVLVGKGLMFDSGGYSLKPSSGMETMKCDMSGSAAVMGAMLAIARLGVKRKVIAVVAACENMIGGGAYRVGDVFVGMNGKSVEVLNTDAEGRLTLADALTYAQSFKPELVVDVATLTGACVVALGEQTVGVFADDEVAETLLDAFERAGEDAWRLPLNPRLKKLIKSEIADMKNTGGRFGGAITAGLFLKEFVDDVQKWAHLDIAGPAFNGSAVGHMPVGGSGVAVSSLVELVDPSK